MGKLGGFISDERKEPNKRTIEERLRDYLEIESTFSLEDVITQAGRCMDCGVPFCHFSCPLCNVVPEFNDAIYRKQFKKAAAILLSTNNFPEFTGRLCPALCEKGCVLNLGFKAVTISDIEKYIIEIAWEENWIVPNPPEKRTGKKVAVIGSGPSGLAVADQLNKAGHLVTVFEKHKEIGGILRYGIPDFKIEKSVIERRVKLLKEEGVIFKTGINVGTDITAEQLKKDFDAVCLTMGAERPRDINVPGRNLKGVEFAMDFLIQQNKRVSGEKIPSDEILAKDKNVLIIGGGDTGADCVGNSNRQGAQSVTQVEIMPKPPVERTEDMPWPTYPNLFKQSTSHEEGCERIWSVNLKELKGNKSGQVESALFVKLEWEKDNNGKMTMKEIPGSEFELKAELVIIAAGFVKPVSEGIIDQFGLALDERGNVKIESESRMSSVKGIFAAGDVSRGASLIVHAIADGRRAARGIDIYLTGESQLPNV